MSDGGAAWAKVMALSAHTLAQAGVASAEHDARELAEAVTGKSAALLALDTQTVTPEQASDYRKLICRRAAREPLQHILGTMYFRCLELESKPGVFIVRPETEMVAQTGVDFLVSRIRAANFLSNKTAQRERCSREDVSVHSLIDHELTDGETNDYFQKYKPIIAVDLFSGSGAIALALATELASLAAVTQHTNHAYGQANNSENCTELIALPSSSFPCEPLYEQPDCASPSPSYSGSTRIFPSLPELCVYGVEFSSTAYESAQRNNARYGNPVTFIHSNALAPLPEPYEQQIRGKVELVIANPPYVPEYHELSPEVQADPHEALFGGGEDGLDIPLRTIVRAWDLLAPGGLLIIEHASEQSTALREAAHNVGFTAVVTGRDLTGAERWLQAEKPEANE